MDEVGGPSPFGQMLLGSSTLTEVLETCTSGGSEAAGLHALLIRLSIETLQIASSRKPLPAFAHISMSPGDHTLRTCCLQVPELPSSAEHSPARSRQSMVLDKRRSMVLDKRRSALMADSRRSMVIGESFSMAWRPSSRLVTKTRGSNSHISALRQLRSSAMMLRTRLRRSQHWWQCRREKASSGASSCSAS